MNFCWKGAWEGGYKLKSKTRQIGCLLRLALRWDILPAGRELCRKCAGWTGPQPQVRSTKIINKACKTQLFGRLLAPVNPHPALFLQDRLAIFQMGPKSMGVWNTVQWFKGWEIPQARSIRSFPGNLETHREADRLCSWATADPILVLLTLWTR